MPRQQKMIRQPNAAEEAMKQEAFTTMRSARTEMLMRFPFLGELAMQLEIIPVLDERLPVACTDGAAVYINAHVIEYPEKVFKQQFREGKLTGKADTAIAILAHEVWHCALLHFDRGEGKDHMRFNIASDIEIGYLLEKAGIPDLSTAKASWGDMLKGLPAERIYGMLTPPKMKNDPPPLSGNNNPVKIKSSAGKKSDEKDKNGKPDETRKKTGCESGNPKDENDDNNSSAGDEKLKEKFSDGHYSRIRTYPPMRSLEPEYGNENLRDPDFTPGTNQSKGDADDLRQKWHDGVKKAANRHGFPGYRAGNLPGNLQDVINSTHKNTVDWKQVLLDYVSQMFGGERQWLPPNRRYVWKDLYLPRRAKQQTIELVLALDTSGSTTEDLPDFLAELRGMATAFGEYKLTIIQCDTRIRSIKEYSNDDPLPEKLQFYGFGGTSLIPPFNYLKGKTPPAVFIYLTDGFGDAPAKAPDYPVIWCLTTGGVKPADWGMEVKIKEK